MSEHLIRFSRYQRGKTPIRPTRVVYGTSGTCSCGWRGKWNDAPSKGGRSGVLSVHLTETGIKAKAER